MSHKPSGWISASAGILIFLLTSCVHHVAEKPPVVKNMEVITQPEPKTPVGSSGEKKPSAPIKKFPISKAKVKIGIRVEVQEVGVSCDIPINVTNLTTKKTKIWTAGKHLLSSDSLLADIRIVPSDSDHYLEWNEKKYRGAFLVHRSGGKVTLINELGIDDYLRGVLPREAVVSWPLECLKVQAVASRTYLVSHLGRHAAQGFDLCSDVHCQVYGGMGKEHPTCNQAVDETRGEILTYQGRPIDAYFHSNCGGTTEEVEYVWGLAHEPYLPRVRCIFGTGDPRYHWSYEISDSVMLAKLKAKSLVTGSDIISCRIAKKSPSGRAERIAVRTDEGNFEMKGNDFRIALDPEKIRSTLWTSIRRLRAGYQFEGLGWGHGIGMCQWGAKGQAERGRTYDEILKFYYPHTQLTSWDRK